MNAILTRWATPLTLGLFAVSAVSGVALFFHVGQGVFHEMHEWLSMVLLLPFLLHMVRNWTPLLNYMKRSALWAPLGLSLVAAAAFAAPAVLQGGGGGGPMAAAQLMMRAPLADVAPLFKTDPDGLRAALAARGYKVAAGDSLERLAAEAHASPFALIAALAPKP
jgi:hypothetical protein